MGSAKIEVGISMLSEVREGEFDAARGILVKVLANVVASPTEEKYRKLRATNQKIGQMLAVRGVKALLRGAGFAEEGEFYVLPLEAPVDGVQEALARLEALATERSSTTEAARAEAVAARKEKENREAEERKRQRMQIEDDAAARKEPGWTAKAAGVKGGKAITSCGDIGAQGGGG